MNSFTSIKSSSFFALSLSVAAFSASAPASYGCSVCGCSLSSDWGAQGYGMMSGLQADFRYEYYDQADLRSGRNSVERSSFSYPNDQEIQQDTLNRNAWVDLNYVGGPHWALSAQLPYYDRFHSTIAAGDTGVSISRAAGIGDLRLLGRYQTFGMDQSFSFQFGFKLPSGRFNQNFAAGPQEGNLLDRGLQLGTGTTDLLAGISCFRRPATNLGCFVQATVDQPLAYRDQFLPATTLSLNGGARYLNTSLWTPQLQLNFRWDGRERGALADYANSGDSMAYLSPGVTAAIGAQGSAFMFFQIPLYQRVNGLQLEPRWLLSLGVNWRL